MQKRKSRFPMVVSSHDVHVDSDYVQWIHEIKERFRNTQIKAAIKVNSEQLLFNWQLGRDLTMRKVEEKTPTGYWRIPFSCFFCICSMGTSH